MRKTYIAGNWKMKKTFEEADLFLNELVEDLKNRKIKNSEIIVCPPSLYLELATDLSSESDFYVGGQDCSSEVSGAYTGEISAEMLKSIDLDYCIVGHSERRQYHKESNLLLNKKLKRLKENEIIPIYCVGETETQREDGITEEIILEQLKEGLKDISAKNLVIAYEPVWAIGTGKTATPKMAQDVHSLIRNWISKGYSQEIAKTLPILYGGSVNPSNLEELLNEKDIDGGLIGGAALDIKSFINMINISESRV